MAMNKNIPWALATILIAVFVSFISYNYALKKEQVRGSQITNNAVDMVDEESATGACSNPMTQTEMTICSYEEFKIADAELNTTYQNILKRYVEYNEYNPNIVIKLREAQKAWIIYRDKQCDAEGEIYNGGSMQPMIINGCATSLTNAQIEILNTIDPSYD